MKILWSALLSLFVCCLCITEFDSSTQISTPALLLFYSTLCVHCQRFKPLWNYIPNIFPGLNLYQIDARKYSKYASQFSVKSYPSLRLVKDASTALEFQGERSLHRLSEFLTLHTGLEPLLLAHAVEDVTNTLIPSDFELVMNSTDGLFSYLGDFTKKSSLILALAPQWSEWFDPTAGYEHLALEPGQRAVYTRADSTVSSLSKLLQIQNYPAIVIFSLDPSYRSPAIWNRLLKRDNVRRDIYESIAVSIYDSQDLRNAFPLDGTQFLRQILKHRPKNGVLLKKFFEKDYELEKNVHIEPESEELEGLELVDWAKLREL